MGRRFDPDRAHLEVISRIDRTVESFGRRIAWFELAKMLNWEAKGFNEFKGMRRLAKAIS